MKPLPLLLTLVTLALVAAITLTQRKPASAQTELPQAPLPFDFEEPTLPIPSLPLIKEEFIPEQSLLTFVEDYLQLKFTTPPVFTPVPAEDIIITVERAIQSSLETKQLNELNITAKRLKLLPDFQIMDHNIVTILAGEMRGLITPTRNLVLNDFASTSPPEQAALVNLLAQRLLLQKLPFPKPKASIDEILAQHFAIRSLSLATEKEFRKSLPNYPASLNENLRESILLGLPAFFHELSAFAEFHLIEKFETTSPAKALAHFSEDSPTPSRSLLAFPFRPEPHDNPTHLGAIPLYLLLLESTDPTTARTLATALISDQIRFENEIFIWTLEFTSDKLPSRAAEFFRSYYSLRDPERKTRIEVDRSQLHIKVQAP